MQRRHPFFRFLSHTHSHRFMSSTYMCLPKHSSLPPLMFSSLPDPTSGPPKRSRFMPPDWAYVTHTNTQHTSSLRTHELPVNPAAAHQLCCGGSVQDMHACWCVSVHGGSRVSTREDYSQAYRIVYAADIYLLQYYIIMCVCIAPSLNTTEVYTH